MDALKKQLNTPLGIGLVSLVVGILFGLVVLGWWLWPVKWINASPQELDHKYQVQFMRMAIDSFAQNKDVTLAKERYMQLGPKAEAILGEIIKNPASQSIEAISAFGAAALAGIGPTSAPGAAVEPTAVVAGQAGKAQPTPTAQPAASGGIGGLLKSFLIILLLLGLVLVLAFFLRNRRLPKVVPAPKTPEAAVPEETPVAVAPQALPEDVPLAQFMASYKLGDDLFDDSYSIDSPSGEFLGECGVEISETIGVGDPKKVTAFEVWLFDKNDIQTVTRVLMSEHAFKDNNIRQRLAAKGEPVLITPGATTSLVTQTLELVVHIVDMAYGEGALPAESFFERFILQLDVYKKA